MSDKQDKGERKEMSTPEPPTTPPVVIEVTEETEEDLAALLAQPTSTIDDAFRPPVGPQVPSGTPVVPSVDASSVDPVDPVEECDRVESTEDPNANNTEDELAFLDGFEPMEQLRLLKKRYIIQVEEYDYLMKNHQQLKLKMEKLEGDRKAEQEEQKAQWRHNKRNKVVSSVLCFLS